MHFADEMKSMCESLAQSRLDREKVMKELHSDFSLDGTERKAGLKRLFGDVHIMIQHFHTSRGKMSKELRQMLEGYFEGIQKNVRGFLREFRTQHKAISGKQQAELKTFRAGLQKEVKDLMNQFRNMIREYRANFKKAHGYWLEFAGKMKQARQTSKKSGYPNLQARIMATLKDSPDGMTLKELSYAVGTSEKSLGRALMRMCRQGHIRKRKNTYCAA